MMEDEEAARKEEGLRMMVNDMLMVTKDGPLHEGTEYNLRRASYEDFHDDVREGERRRDKWFKQHGMGYKPPQKVKMTWLRATEEETDKERDKVAVQLWRTLEKQIFSSKETPEWYRSLRRVR